MLASVVKDMCRQFDYGDDLIVDTDTLHVDVSSDRKVLIN